MELEQRTFVSWHLSKCCQDISESIDILEKSVLKKPYYGMIVKSHKNSAKEPIDDIMSKISYESEKMRLDKKLAKQMESDKKN